MVSARDNAEAAACAFVDVCEPAGIAFLIDQRVVGLRSAEDMAIDLHRAVIVVEPDVKERFRVRRPDNAPIGFLDDVSAVDSRLPVANADTEVFGAANIRAPCLQLVIGGMARFAEFEVFGLLRQFIAVDDEVRRAGCLMKVLTRHAADLLMLAAFAILVEISKRPIRRGNAGVIFLDTCAHFRDELLLKPRGVAEHRVGIGVFSLEIGANVGLKHGRIAQNLLPVLILQPGVVIGDRYAVV